MICVKAVKYTINYDAAENGTFTVTAGGNNVASGSEVEPNTEITITPSPASGYELDAITVNGQALAAGTYTFNVAADSTIVVTFKTVTASTYEAVVTAADNGIANVQLKKGEDAAISTTPAGKVYTFSNLPVADTYNVVVTYATGYEKAAAEAAQTVSNASKTATVASQAKTYAIKYNKNGHGDNVSDGSYTYDAETVTLADAPANATGWTFKGWYTAATGGTKVENAAGVKALITAETTTTDGVTLYAQWDEVVAPTFTVSGTASAGVTKVALTGNGITAGQKEVVPSSDNSYAVSFAGIPAGTYTVTATVNDDDYYLATKTASVTVSASDDASNAFTFTAIPVIKGTVTVTAEDNKKEVGKKLTASAASTNDPAETSFTYTWQKKSGSDWAAVVDGTDGTVNGADFTPSAVGTYKAIATPTAAYHGTLESGEQNVTAAGVVKYTIAGTINTADSVSTIQISDGTNTYTATIDGTAFTSEEIVAGNYYLIVTPATGYKFTSAMKDTTNYADSDSKVAVSANVTGVAVTMAAKSKVTITAAANPADGGTVSITDATDVDAADGLQLYEGDTFKVSATANAHYTKGAVTVKDNDNADVTDNDGVYTVPSGKTAITVTVAFAKDKVVVTPTGTAATGKYTVTGGEYTIATLGDENKVDYGTQITITPTADTENGYELDAVYAYATTGGEKSNETKVANNSGYKVTVEAATTIEVVFKKTDYTVTTELVKATDNGTVTFNKAKANKGDTVTITIDAADNYSLKADTLKATYGSGTELVLTGPAQDGTYTFTMPAANVVVTAEFEADVTPAAVYQYNGTTTIGTTENVKVPVFVLNKD